MSKLFQEFINIDENAFIYILKKLFMDLINIKKEIRLMMTKESMLVI